MITIYCINKYAGLSGGVKGNCHFGAIAAPVRLAESSVNLFLTIIIMCGKSKFSERKGRGAGDGNPPAPQPSSGHDAHHRYSDPASRNEAKGWSKMPLYWRRDRRGEAAGR